MKTGTLILREAIAFDTSEADRRWAAALRYRTTLIGYDESKDLTQKTHV